MADLDDPLKQLLEALAMCDKYVKGCGDSSCHFVRPTGMATNGGCRCLDGRGPKQPEAIVALSLLLRAAKLAAPRLAQIQKNREGHGRSGAGEPPLPPGWQWMIDAEQWPRR